MSKSWMSYSVIDGLVVNMSRLSLSTSLYVITAWKQNAIWSGPYPFIITI